MLFGGSLCVNLRCTTNDLMEKKTIKNPISFMANNFTIEHSFPISKTPSLTCSQPHRRRRHRHKLLLTTKWSCFNCPHLMLFSSGKMNITLNSHRYYQKYHWLRMRAYNLWWNETTHLVIVKYQWCRSSFIFIFIIIPLLYVLLVSSFTFFYVLSHGFGYITNHSFKQTSMQNPWHDELVYNNLLITTFSHFLTCDWSLISHRFLHSLKLLTNY